MTEIAKTGSSYSLAEILTRQNTAAGKKQTPRQTLLDNIRENDPQKADDIEKKMDSADQVVAQLRTGKIKEMKQRKKEAIEKIKRIKQEIQMLKTMGGDPKMLARRIAQLAKELAQAAREYASATASASDAASQDGTETSNAAAGTSGTAASMLKDATGLGGIDSTSAVTIDTSTNTSAADTSASDGTAPAAGQEKKNEDVSDASQDGTNSQGVSLGEGLKQYQEAQRQKLVGGVESIAAEIQQKTAEAEADRQFAQDVRNLSAILKAMAKQLKQRLHRAGDYRADQDFTKIDKALAEAEKSVASLGASTMSATADTAAATTSVIA